jgi:hypothetical protein
MRPKREQEPPQPELFQVELEQLIDLHRPLVRLGMCIDWALFEQALGAVYHPTLCDHRPHRLTDRSFPASGRSLEFGRQESPEQCFASALFPHCTGRRISDEARF